MPKNRYLIKWNYFKPVPPKRLLKRTGKIESIEFSGTGKIFYIVGFIHEINLKEGYVSKELQYFYEKELEKAQKKGIKDMKKWEDLIYAKQLAVKL